MLGYSERATCSGRRTAGDVQPGIVPAACRKGRYAHGLFGRETGKQWDYLILWQKRVKN